MAELPERLREAAAAHRPDRERILARVEQAMAAPDGQGPAGERERSPRDSRPAPWMRVAAVAAAVAGAVGLGGLAVGAVTGSTGTPGRSVVSTAGDSGAPPPVTASGTASGPPHSPTHPVSTAPVEPGRGSEHASGRVPVPPASGTPAGTATPAAPSGGTPSKGAPPATSGSSSGVSCVGSVDSASNDYWTQSDVRLTVGRPLTSLHIELRIARTTGVSSTGSFDSVSGQTAASVAVEGDYLVYRWDLDAGQTLAAGTYTFAGQFNHAGGDRDTSGDRYTAVANGPGGAVTLGGSY
ncbi:hypothetical protein [Actinacidiphila acidipaludis]|uniref:Uncharacterized protein n=1 Tax=Actinacidiphila acidipaludis TaxID=2873382 RepID=A0ABS7QEG3_9ACTN|nr:hypothetical protein [Streptomyces acidipaludis]MBY8880322.1 hypothetical protein [Streptomyces acidipaludis]